MMSVMKLGRFSKIAAAVVAAAAMVGAATAGAVSAEPKAVIGGKAPDFTLSDTAGVEVKLSEVLKKEKIVVLEWYNPECPFVKKHYDGEKGPKTMIELQKKFADDVVWLRINSGAPGKQGAGKEKNIGYAKDFGIATPILLDETGVVGQMYGAKRTPEMFVISAEGVIEYHGAIDDNRRTGRKANEVNHVEAALEQLIAGETVTVRTTDAYGCSVKYAG